MNFLRSFETNKRSKVILATIVNMAKELGMHTLAEGVETQEQYAFLRDIGCEKLQGYLFGKPKPYEEFVKPDEFTFEHCEDVRYKQYYRRIGDINLLGSIPLRDKNLEVFNNLPIAIMEDIGDEIRAIYANTAYRMFLNSVGISSIEDADKRSNTMEYSDTVKLREAMDRAEKSDKRRSEVDCLINGNVVNSKMRFLAKEGDRRAFAIVSRNMSIKGNDNHLAENIHVAMVHVFNQYFRVDLYDQDGTVENVYLNTEQLAVADQENDAVKAVEIYTDMYLFPEDRQRFRDFYSIPTVLDRCREQNTKYVVDYYRSAIPGDNGRMQMYLILPFLFEGRWKYISCCRYADEIKENVWK